MTSFQAALLSRSTTDWASNGSAIMTSHSALRSPRPKWRKPRVLKERVVTVEVRDCGHGYRRDARYGPHEWAAVPEVEADSFIAGGEIDATAVEVFPAVAGELVVAEPSDDPL
jgi:hypothetical protein